MDRNRPVFVLSGYPIAGSAGQSRTALAKAGNRCIFRLVFEILRPYVAFLMVVALTFPVPWGHFGIGTRSLGEFRLGIRQIDCRRHDSPMVVGGEEQFYLLWPWVVLWCSRRTLKRVAVRSCCSLRFYGLFVPLCSEVTFRIYSLMPVRADTLASAPCQDIGERTANWIRLNSRAALVRLDRSGSLSRWRFPSYRPSARVCEQRDL